MNIQTVNEKNYIVSESGTYYREGTTNEIINILERVRYRGERIQVFYGDVKTGRNWNEELDVCGTIGRSTGTIKIPLLIATKRSSGGGAILTDCIIGIKQGKTIVYKANNFIDNVYKVTKGDLPEYPFSTLINGELYGRHKTEQSAKRLINKLNINS
jgi:hypothetical protein